MKNITIIIIGMFIAGFMYAEWVRYVESKIIKSEAHRGCVASAYQAEKNGFDLESNLNYCKNI